MALPTMATGLVVGQYVVPGGSATPRAAKGIIEFTADVPYNPIPLATPNAYTIVPMRVIGVLDDEGFVCTPIAEGSTTPGGQGVRLPATDVAQGSVEKWTWTATPKFTPPEGVRASSNIDPFTFGVPAGKTTDLATVAKVPASVGNGTEQIVALAAAAARSAIDTAADLKEVKGQALANDAGVAAFLKTGTATKAALTAALDPLVTKGSQVLNPKDYGAVGNGVADDTAALQAAVNAAPTSGGTVILPPGARFKFTTLNLNNPHVSIIGNGGTLLDGTIYVGSDTAIEEYSGRIEGVRYDGRAANITAKSFIVLKRCRGFKITNNTIENTGKAIAVPPTTTGFHSVAMLDITDNRFAGVDVAFHSETTEWDTLSDMGFIRNNVNYARYFAIKVTGTDGATITQNKLFMLNYSSTLGILKDKKQSIWIDTSDQLHITDNNIFEAGLEGIYLGSPTNINITGNHIVWPGQAYPSDAISINGGQPRGTIANNTFVNFTKSAIGIYDGDPRRLEIGDNMYRWLETPASYFGTEPLPTNAKRFRVYVDVAAVADPIIRDYYPVEVFDSIQGRHSTAQDRKGEFQGVTAAVRRSVPVTGPDALVFRLTDIKNLSRYGGLVVVTARSSGANEAKTATYVLLVSYTQTMSQCVLIAQAGHTTGAAADDPSFTWNIFGEHLRASPVGATNYSSFWIEAISLGATALR